MILYSPGELMGNRRPLGGEPAHSWSYHEVKHGKFFDGYKAGPMFACEAHTKPTSKPCLKIATRGKVQCQCERSPIRTEWKGWLPVYDIDHKPVFLVLGEHTFEIADAIPTFAKLVFGRGTGERDTPWVRLQAGAKPYRSNLIARQQPVDIAPFLCNTLWKMPFLMEYGLTALEVEQNPEPPAVSLKQPKPPAKENDIRTMVARTLIDQVGGEQPASLAADAVNAAVNRMTRPSAESEHRKNGHLPKKG